MPRIQRIELNEKNTRLRWIIAGVLLVVGLIAIAIGVNSCVSAPTGWQEVQITADKTNCSSDFVLNYCYGQADTEPTLERRQVVACYSEAVVTAWELFNTDVEGSELGNLSLLNQSPNKIVTVEAALYQALKQVVEAKSRYLYLAPVYENYGPVFRADSPVLAEQYDPTRNAELQEYVWRIAELSADPAHIDLVLLDNNQVELRVSEAYLTFAEENGVTNLLDFGWMKNAFIADFLAQELENAGHTNGYLASYDGYTRNLDSRGNAYSFNLFDRMDNSLYIPAVWQYEAPNSIVFLRNYPMSDRDAVNYYLYEDGSTTHTMVSPADGLCKTATDNLVGYSKDAGCAEIALALAPVFIADQLDAETLNGLTEQGIYSIWFDGDTLLYNDADADITGDSPEGVSYRKQLSQTK